MTIKTTKIKIGESYPRNGNVNNPTPRFMWQVWVDSKIEGDFYSAKSAREFARSLCDGSL